MNNNQLHDHKYDHDHDHDHAHDHDHPHEQDHHKYDHDHLHDDDHAHDHDLDYPHDHKHRNGFMGMLEQVFHLRGHSHQHGSKVNEEAFLANEEGIRTVWMALGLLLVTAVIQIIIVTLSGSVALLADTVHNIGDGLNSVPLLIAFYLARRIATRRYNYGFGKAEDVAGIFIVLSIAFSAGVIFWESFQKFLHPEPIQSVGWVAVAAIIGFLGNEAVAILQIRVGRKIGSAAMVADGLHARTDGLTSLAVLLAVGGSWLGFPIVDPIIGVLIGIAILFITKDASITMWYRLMDAIEPDVLAKAESVVQQQPQVQDVCRVRMRWMGHQLHTEVVIAVDAQLTTAESHAVAEAVRHALFHEVANLAEVVVHVEPWTAVGTAVFHEETAHHEPVPESLAAV